ncbi:flap endonuclease-1 [Candidatus Micrarchaeota archaeon]|nr:MAG: flap endonuclease-1 [Candidatus Micrarchaeota archaeon]
MGVQLSDIIEKEKISIDSLKGRKISIDAFNTLYQFLSIIRQFDGSPLKDSQGRVTSHLSGLFYRTVRLFEKEIRPAYVFDGEPPVMKEETVEERKKIRAEAKEKWEEAVIRGDMENARKYAQASSKLTAEMIEESKKLLEYMGVPVIQAPSEGEAQAAYIAAKGDVWASASQDYDSLLFGSPILIRNLTITGKRKLPGKSVYVDVLPEKISLQTVLDELKISREDLIEIAMIIGTDFNKGVKGIGPKKALALVKAGKTVEEVYKEHNISEDIDFKKLRSFFLNPPVTKNYKLEWKKVNEEKLIELLVEEHDFSIDRIKNGIEKLLKAYENKGTQARIDRWF